MEQTTEAPRSTPLNPQEVLETILQTLGFAAKVQTITVEGAPRLQIQTEEPGRIIGRQGQTINQLQFLVNRILQRHDVNAPRVMIDCEGSRDREREREKERARETEPVRPNNEVLEKAIETCNRVRRWGDPAQAGPFNEADRRAILEHFASDRELEIIVDAGDEAAQKSITIRIRPLPLHSAPRKVS